MLKKLIQILILGVCLSSCEQYKPPMEYPVVYVDTSDYKAARWTKSVKTIILRDKNGDTQELRIQRGYYDRWADSIFHNCKIGDTIK